MKRVWKPLDVGMKRLYSVTLEYFTKEGKRAYGNTEPPKLVMADSPSNATEIMDRLYNPPGQEIRAECYGKAVNVCMPKSWWEDGTPEKVKLLENEIEALHRERIGEVWYWQGDNEDHLESLTCPVLIEAEELRTLLKRNERTRQ